RLPGLGDAGRHPRRPRRLRAVLPAGRVSRPSRYDFDGVEGRHVLSRRAVRRPRRHSAFLPPPPAAAFRAVRHRRLVHAARPVPRAHRQLRQWRAVRPAVHRALGDGLSQWRPRPAPSEPALRGVPRGAGVVHRAVRRRPLRQGTPADGTPERHLLHRLWGRPHRRRAVPRARRQPQLPGRRHDDGAMAVRPDDPARDRLRAPPAPGAVTTLEQALVRRIRLAGPLTVADYMTEVLLHPTHGYYRQGDPLGAAGDFVTAPEISQMFGELIGLWCVDQWMRLSEPPLVRLGELGPGRGSLLADALRAARLRPGLLAAIRLHLVESSPALRERQAEALGQLLPVAPAWHDGFAEVPADGVLLLIANEFFDALP